jgi:energy-coupling factor transporter ATP-binding protein EcfA2
MAATIPATTPKPEFTDILQGLSFESKADIQKKETGQKLAERIYGAQTNGTSLNFFNSRSIQWIENEKWALGKQSNKEFLQFFNVAEGEKAYLAMDMSPVMLGPQFMGTLVDSMAKNEEYPQVTAIDDGSMSEKARKKKEALYRMSSPEIAEMEEAAGLAFEAPDAYVPENETAAEIYFELEDRLPKEIKMERKLEKVLVHNSYQRVLKPQLLFDLIVKNAAFTKVEIDGSGNCCIRKCIAQNMIYNYFQGDTGKLELGYIGETYSLKVKDMRKLFPKLTEKELHEIAKTSTQYNVGTTFNWPWIPEFQIYNYDRPWDDFSVPIFDFEIDVTTSEYFVSRIDNYGNENIDPKKSVPKPTSEKSKVIREQKSRWYRGVYAPYAKQMLYWGLPDVVLLPFLNVKKSVSSYSVVIPFNNGQYIPSLFQRGLEPLKEYTMVNIKRKQLITKLRPSGIRIDIESARNIDLGNGQSMAWEEVMRIFDQTGNEIWSSRGVDPLSREAPALSAPVQNDDLQRIIQMTQTLESIVVELRNLWGVPMYRDGSDVGDRTSGKLAQQQATSSFNVTDFIENAENELMEQTLYKCLLYEWQKGIKNNEDDSDEQINTEYRMHVKMRPTQYQQELLAQRIEKWTTTIDGNGNPLLSPKDAFYIENIKDFKLANLYLANVIDTNKKRALEQAKAQSDYNAKAQQDSLAQQAENNKELEQMKHDMEMQIKKADETAKNRSVLLTGIFDMLKTGAPIPPQMMPLVNEVMTNIALPLAVENEETRRAIQEKMQAEQQQAEMQAQQEAQIMQMSQQTGVPPEEIAAQLEQQQMQQQQMSAA